MTALPWRPYLQLALVVASGAVGVRERQPFAWRVTTPEAQSLSSARLGALKDRLAAKNTKILLVIRNDAIAYEWYSPDHSEAKTHYTASMAKALVAGLSLGVALTD